jgi:preprotein translocase subunit YajC
MGLSFVLAVIAVFFILFMYVAIKIKRRKANKNKESQKIHDSQNKVEQ